MGKGMGGAFSICAGGTSPSGTFTLRRIASRICTAVIVNPLITKWGGVYDIKVWGW